MIDFNNTENAFRIKSDWELKKAYYLFKLIGNPALTKLGNAIARFALRVHFPVAWFVKPTIYAHFVGGESIEKCSPVVRKLADFKVKAILDYSVEGGEKEEDFQRALDETLKTINNAVTDVNIPFVVFKPTAFAPSYILEKAGKGENNLNEKEKIELAAFRARVNRLCKAAYDAEIPILIDAEHSYYQDIIDVVVRENQQKFNRDRAIVFNTYQMYRHDRLEYLKQDFELAQKEGYFLGAKFVRGAYMEMERERAEKMGYPDPIQPNKEATDRDYNAALKFCVEHIDRISIFNGTHNEYSSNYLVELMQEYNIDKGDKRCFFSQLYGMSDHISFNLAEAGYNVAKYLPFGPVRSVLPYLIRRAEENTSIAGQTSRELMLIKMELIRRKA
jgi:proline dehydrogenase